MLALAGTVLAPSIARGSDVGVVSSVTWGQSRSDIDREVELLGAAGVQWARINANWRWIESDRKGQLDEGLLASFDYAVDSLHRAGIQIVIPVADGVPYWASSDPHKYVDARGNRHWDAMYPPSRMADYGDIVRTLVERYAPRGVHAYEIWNEPNLHWFWSPRPDARAYVPMLKAGYRATKQADPRSTVLLGGLSKNDFHFLEQIYAAGGGPFFDAVAVHPYTFGVDPTVSWTGWEDPGSKGDPSRLSWNSFPAIREIRKTMRAHGDSAKKVWVTEFGWASTSADGGVSRRYQARYLRKALRYVEQFPWVETMFWYQARNHPFMNDKDAYDSQFGLFGTDWSLKPSYRALRDYISESAVIARGKGSRTAPRRARLTVGGKVRREAAGRRARVQVRRAGGWRTVARTRVRADRTYGTATRVRVGAQARSLEVRTAVRNVGASRSLPVKLG